MLLGSLAATMQAAIGPVVGRSLFATLQSAAMGGYGVPIVLGPLQGIAVAGLVTGFAGYLPWRKHTRSWVIGWVCWLITMAKAHIKRRRLQWYC